MLVWILLIGAWLLVLLITAISLELGKATAVLALLFILDFIVLCVWASNYILQYFQVWPYLSQ